MRPMNLPFQLLLLAAWPAMATAAATPANPEIERGPATAQAVGVVHTLRTIPEACARLEGVFTGDAAEPYRFAPVRSREGCQPRARFVDAAKANPSTKDGWLLNDRLRVPSAECPSQHAVVEIWRRPGSTASPKLDAQGKARIYLDEEKQKAAANRPVVTPMFAATMEVQGRACK